LPVAEQPDMLTKAAMDFCLADAFHPGCEMTWPMRTSGMYMAPFRLKHAPKTPPVNTVYYGPVMNNDIIPLAEGPLQGGQVAGGVTRWMAIPWQTDTASCRDGYTTTYDPYLPTFWPARVPNNVLNEARYDQVMNPELGEETRLQAFAVRSAWLDNLPLDGGAKNYTNQINSMVKYFDKLAVVQKRPGLPGDPNFPEVMQVGITMSPEQEMELIAETLSEVEEILQSPVLLGTGMQDLLRSAVDTLAHKDLLQEQLLQENARDQLLRLTSTELAQDHPLTPPVEKLLSLLAAKTHKKARSTAMQHRPRTVEVGVPEKMNRFTRYRP